MSIKNWNISFIRKSSRQVNSRSNVCCEVEDANGEPQHTLIKHSKLEQTTRNKDTANCQCKNHLSSDRQGIFKSIKKKFSLKPSISRPFKSKTHHSAKVRDSTNCTINSSVNDASSSDGFTSNSRKLKPLPFRLIRNSFDKGTSHRLSVLEQEDKSQQIKQSGEASSRNSIVEFAKKRLGVPKSYCQSGDKNLDNGNNDLVANRTNTLENSLNPLATEGVTHLIMRLDSDVQYEPEHCDIPESPHTHSITCELFKLAQYGWYWGPITREEAEDKLLDLPDGSFLVRDSAADRYLLSVSFRSSGKTFHTRIEHSHGLFSLYSSPGQEGFSSIIELINHSMSYSESAVFCYSRPRAPGYPAFPVRLVKPVSRFTQVRSLQYLCRFVIRQYTRVDNIQKLPLPNKLKGYIQEGHY